MTRTVYSTPLPLIEASLMSASQEQVFVGTSPDIDPEDPQQVKKVYYNPEHYLRNLAQQALNQAVRYNQIIKIEGPWPEITFDILNNKIWVSANVKQLRPYCTMPDTTLEVAFTPVEVDWTPPAAASPYPRQPGPFMRHLSTTRILCMDYSVHCYNKNQQLS
jgi:hypothetical protein